MRAEEIELSAPLDLSPQSRRHCANTRSGASRQGIGSTDGPVWSNFGRAPIPVESAALPSRSPRSYRFPLHATWDHSSGPTRFRRFIAPPDRVGRAHASSKMELQSSHRPEWGAQAGTWTRRSDLRPDDVDRCLAARAVTPVFALDAACVAIASGGRGNSDRSRCRCRHLATGEITRRLEPSRSPSESTSPHRARPMGPVHVGGSCHGPFWRPPTSATLAAIAESSVDGTGISAAAGATARRDLR